MDHDDQASTAFWRSPAGIALGVALLAMGFYLVTEHTAHLLGILPYLLVLACPLMHVFMHGGHHGRHGNPQQRGEHDGQRRQ
ncbi:MAG TPA: DUF2933 domain-containing protein [Arthrobacter sp.]